MSIELKGCSVDVLEVLSLKGDGLTRLSTTTLKQMAAMFAGHFLSGLTVDHCPIFDAWLGSLRRRLDEQHITILKELTGREADVQGLASEWAEKWLQVSPLDLDAHRALLQTLIARNQFKAGDEHIDSSIKLFQAEGLHLSPLRELWRELRSGRVTSSQLTQEEGSRPYTISLPDPDRHKRVVLAVMPFEENASDRVHGGVADGLTHDIITRLAKLRAFSVIARGSVYAVAEKGMDPQQAGRKLGVEYVASGTVEHAGDRARIFVELVDVDTARIVWSDRFEVGSDELLDVLDEVGNAIVAAIANEIETAERDRAILKPPTSLNAWEAYHRGLWHMYRFTQEENLKASEFFQTAIQLDPTFARAYSGLSFTHWQTAFQGWDIRDREMRLAYDAAGKSLLVDSHSPESHWAMGRALWLMGDNEASFGALSKAVELSPHFALGHYALAFVQSQSGEPAAAIDSADQSRHLSPFDPLLFGMLGARAMSHVRLEQFDEAAEWAIKAAARPNAHVGILAIAANSLGLAGRYKEGRAFAARIRATHPDYGIDNFLSSFHFEKEGADLFRRGAKVVGLD